MTNKEWLEKMRKDDEINFKDVDNDLLEFLQEQIYSDELDYRRTRATEIIAEELIKLNEDISNLVDCLWKTGTGRYE